MGLVQFKQTSELSSALIPVGAAVACVILCVALIKSAEKVLPNVAPFCATKIKASDNDLVTFVLAYLLPLVASKDANIDVFAVCFALGLLLLIVMSTHAYQTNPLLALLGYHFYEIESTNGITYFMLSKRRLNAASDIKSVKQLAPFVILDSMS